VLFIASKPREYYDHVFVSSFIFVVCFKREHIDSVRNLLASDGRRRPPRLLRRRIITTTTTATSTTLRSDDWQIRRRRRRRRPGFVLFEQSQGD
jgi:hypothetical protein